MTREGQLHTAGRQGWKEIQTFPKPCSPRSSSPVRDAGSQLPRTANWEHSDQLESCTHMELEHSMPCDPLLQRSTPGQVWHPTSSLVPHHQPCNLLMCSPGEGSHRVEKLPVASCVTTLDCLQGTLVVHSCPATCYLYGLQELS